MLAFKSRLEDRFGKVPREGQELLRIPFGNRVACTFFGNIIADHLERRAFIPQHIAHIIELRHQSLIGRVLLRSDMYRLPFSRGFLRINNLRIGIQHIRISPDYLYRIALRLRIRRDRNRRNGALPQPVDISIPVHMARNGLDHGIQAFDIAVIHLEIEISLPEALYEYRILLHSGSRSYKRFHKRILPEIPIDDGAVNLGVRIHIPAQHRPIKAAMSFQRIDPADIDFFRPAGILLMDAVHVSAGSRRQRGHRPCQQNFKYDFHSLKSFISGEPYYHRTC